MASGCFHRSLLLCRIRRFDLFLAGRLDRNEREHQERASERCLYSHVGLPVDGVMQASCVRKGELRISRRTESGIQLAEKSRMDASSSRLSRGVEDSGPQTFEVRVSDAVLKDLERRLADVRLAPGDGEAGWTLGMNPTYLRELLEYWRTGFDWRAQENAPQRARPLHRDGERYPAALRPPEGPGPGGRCRSF